MESEPNRIKVTMLFPLRDNDGRPFDEETWNWWMDKVLEVLGDFTEMGLTNGGWRGHADQCRWIMAVISEDRLDAVHSFLHEARERFKQKAMYLDFHPVRLELVT